MQAGAGLPSWREDSDEPQVHRSSISTNEAESLGLVGRISSVVMKAARRSLLLDSGADRPMLLKGTEHSRGKTAWACSTLSGRACRLGVAH